MRPLIAQIHPDAISRNIEILSELSATRQIISVVKADGYGHGAVNVAIAAESVPMLAVASVEEAIELTTAGETRPILLLEGPFCSGEVEEIAGTNIQPVLHSMEQIEWMARTRAVSTVWLKLDSGMNRLGFTRGDIVNAVEICGATASLRLEGVVSHYATADEPDSPKTVDAYKRMASLCELWPTASGLQYSFANSAAAVGGMVQRNEWIRLGIAQYGHAPPLVAARGLELEQAMTLRTEIISVRYCEEGEYVGYGGDYLCCSSTRLGVVAAGYADGIPRHTPTGTEVLVAGARVPIVGRICMDMFMVDLTECPQAHRGSEVVIWGPSIPVSEMAEACKTIPNELLSSLTRRVRRVVDSKKELLKC